MTYTMKAFIIALLGTTALTAQVSSVYSMGSDIEPHTTNMITRATAQAYASTQKGKVYTFSGNAVHTSSIGNETFLVQL
jgi:hypothetical protein